MLYNPRLRRVSYFLFMTEAPVQPSRLFNILLVDDHSVVRMGLAGLIACEIECECFGAANRQECVALLQDRKIDLAILDVSLGDENGLDLVGWLKEQGVPALVYSMMEDAETIRRALFEGCFAYVSKRDDSDALLDGIRSALAAEFYLSPFAAAALEKRPEATSRELALVLSRREIQTFEMLGRGYSNNEIAEQLAISPRTAETYVQRIVGKLELPSAKELRKLAIELRVRQGMQPATPLSADA